MYNKLVMKVRGILYVQIWENRLKVTNLMDGKTFDQPPHIAIRTDSKGSKKIIAYGNDASSSIEENTNLFNPFSHPRMLLADALAAQKLLKYVFKKTRSSFLFSPIALIHPMEKIEGDLTYIERTGFKSLAKNSGAESVFLNVGEEVSDDILKGVLFGEISRDEIQQLTSKGSGRVNAPLL
jgi:rod shape-determining protein MreB